MKKTVIVQVTPTTFKTADGREIPHPIPFDPEEVPSVKEFQQIYDRWVEVFRQEGLISSSDLHETEDGDDH